MNRPWMKWQQILVDREQYVEGVLKMMREAPCNAAMPGLEIGLGWGVSALEFLLHFDVAKLVSVDNDNTLEAITMLKHFGDRFEYIDPCTMSLRPDFKCGWLYVDAGHEYEEVRRDLALYEKHLVVGGILAVDDYNTDALAYKYPGVKRAVNEFMHDNAERFTKVKADGLFVTGPAYCRKLKD